MERREVLFFRRRNRWGLTVLSVILCFVMAPVLGMAAMMPQVLALAPVALMSLLGFVGPVSAVICTGICVGMGGTLFGAQGVVAALLLFIPVLIVSAVLVEKRWPFWQSTGIGAATMFASMAAVIAMLTALTGTDVVTAFMGIVREMFGETGGLMDALLMMFAQTGLVPADGVELGAQSIGMILTPEVREKMVNTIVMILDSTLRLELPAQMVVGSAAAGVLGQMLLRKSVLSRGIEVPYPHLRTWRLPKGWGRVLLGTLAVFYVAAQLSPERMNSMLYVFIKVFDLIFAVQGIAAVCYLLHKKGKGKFLKLLTVAAGLFVIRSIALAVGVADQGVDITHRREELGDQGNPYDPFGRKPEE